MVAARLEDRDPRFLKHVQPHELDAESLGVLVFESLVEIVGPLNPRDKLWAVGFPQDFFDFLLHLGDGCPVPRKLVIAIRNHRVVAVSDCQGGVSRRQMPVEWLVPSKLVAMAGQQRGDIRTVEMDTLGFVDAEQTTDRRQQIDDSSRFVLDMPFLMVPGQ